VLVVSISSSDGDGNMGNPLLRRLPVLCGVLGVNMIFGRGVFGDVAAVLIGEVYMVDLTLGEEYDDTLSSASSLLILLLQEVGGRFLGKPIPSSLTSSS